MPGGAEFCILSGTIQDPSGQIFANGTWQLIFKPTPNTPGIFIDPAINGPGFTRLYGGSLDGTGSFNIAGGVGGVVRNDVISPAGSKWTLIVAPNANGQAYQVDLNLAAPSLDCSSLINAAITNVVVNATSIAHAYKDSEVIPVPGSGGIYIDVVNKVIKYFDITNQTWITVSAGGGGTPTGTGFVHIVAGVQDSAARNPVLASSDFANQGTIGTVLIGNAAGNPSFGKVTSSLVDTSIATTGVDINTSDQVVSTHLSAALPTSQGGTGQNSTATFPTTGVVVTETATETLTAKRVTPRVVTLSTNTTFTPDSDNGDISIMNMTATAGTVTIAAPTGTPTDGQKHIIRLKTTNAQTYSFNATYAFSTTVTAPTATTGTKTDYIGIIWNATNTKWDVVAVDQGH